MFDWENLRHYITFARTHSLSGAARELGVEHATVARRIAALEGSLNYKLVDRRQRHYQITPFGHRIAEIGMRMHQDAKAICKVALSVQTETVTPLSISSPALLTSEFIAPHLGKLRREHPAINVSLLVPDDALHSLSNTAGHGKEPDVLVCLLRPTQTDMVVRRIGSVSYGVYASQHYLHSRDREQYEYITYDDSMETSLQHSWLRHLAEDRPVVLRARSLEVQASAARAGLGVALLPTFYADKDSHLNKAASTRPNLQVDVWLGVHEDMRKEPPVRAVMDFLIGCFDLQAAG